MVFVLAVVSLGAAGAAIDSDGGGEGSSGMGSGSGTGIGEGQSGVTYDVEAFAFFDGAIIPTVIGLLAVGGGLFIVVSLLLGLLDRDRPDFRDLFARAAVKIGLVIFGLFAIYLILQQLSVPTGGGSTGSVEDNTRQGAETAADATGLELPFLLGMIVVAVVIAIVVAVFARSRDGDEQTEETAAADSDPSWNDAVGSGNSPDPVAPVGDVSADNEVYRSWLALADAAGANVHRDSPAEVADRAVEEGVEAGTAREITSLFESVRYGEQGATESIEQRAREARQGLGSKQ